MGISADKGSRVQRTISALKALVHRLLLLLLLKDAITSLNVS